jgi:HSP20 family protein
MTRNTSAQNNERTSTSSAGASAQSSQAERTDSQSSSLSRSEGTRGDRERSIHTGREESRGLARPGRSSAVYGPDSGIGASPFMLMRRMAEDMDRLFENFGLAPMGLTSAFGGRLGRDLWNDDWSMTSANTWTPQVETFRRGDKLVVRADLPGLKKEDVKVEVENGILAISGERSEEHEENRDDFFRSERSYGRFYRAVSLPEGVGEDQCEATFKDGVLEVSLPAPKQQERKAKQVPIR